MNDWGIHHLHYLGTSLDADGFLNRDNSNEVLPVIFRPGVAYALDVIRHGEWEVLRLVEAAVRSWPGDRLFLRLGLMGGSNPTPKERGSARKMGLSTPMIVDGVTYFSPTFISTAGTAGSAARQAASTIRKLAYLEDHLSELDSALRKAAALGGVRVPTRPQYRVVSVTNEQSFGFGVEEVATGLCVGIR